jgi:outer membrane protein assembly factor BamA
VTFFRGAPSTTHASTIVGSVAASFTGQLVAGVRLSIHGENNSWLLMGDNRLELASQNSYGLGTASRAANQLTMSYAYPRVNDVAYRRVYKNLYAGVGFHFSNHSGIEPVDSGADAFERSEYVAYSLAHGFDLRSQGAAGTSVNVRVDSRDSSVRATRGMLISASYQTYVKGLLGGDSSWQKLNLDVRGYRSLDAAGRHVMAAWGYADLVTGGAAPYFDLPANGTDMQGRSGRGYAVGRFRGEQLAYAELEYRGTLTRNGLVGMVAFVNATTVSNNRTGERLMGSVAPGAGVGLRLLADKFSRTRVCLDVAVGRQGSRGVYLVLQEAF